MRNRHVHTLLIRKIIHGLRRADTLGNHQHLGHHLLQGFAFPYLLPHMPIPAVPARARHDKIAHSGKPGERHRIRAQCRTQPGDFDDAPIEQCRLCVVPESDAVADSRGYCDDVLEGSPEFHADQIVIRIDPERGTHEDLLDPARRFRILRSGHHDGRDALSDFFRVAGARKADHTVQRNAGHGPRDQLGHSEKRPVLDALAAAHEYRRTQVQARQPFAHGANHVRGQDDEKKRLIACHFLQVGRYFHIRLYGNAWQKIRIFPRFGETPCRILLKFPEGNGMAVRAQEHGEGRPPAPGAEHTHRSAHLVSSFFPRPKRCSSPFNSLLIFERWVTNTSAASAMPR